MKDEEMKGLLFDLPDAAPAENKPSHAPTESQREIACEIWRRGGTATKAELIDVFGKRYYCNAERHFGARLSRMVSAGFLMRVKPGVYRLPEAAQAGKGAE